MKYTDYQEITRGPLLLALMQGPLLLALTRCIALFLLAVSHVRPRPVPDRVGKMAKMHLYFLLVCQTIPQGVARGDGMTQPTACESYRAGGPGICLPVHLRI